MTEPRILIPQQGNLYMQAGVAEGSLALLVDKTAQGVDGPAIYAKVCYFCEYAFVCTYVCVACYHSSHLMAPALRLFKMVKCS